MNEGTWYRAGTVSLTNGSDLVNGYGTQFIDNVLLGAIFFSPTGLTEVTRVISDTQLQIVVPYAGPTVVGVGYEIAPTQGAVVAAAKQLQQFLGAMTPLAQAYEAGEILALPEMAALRDQAIAARGGADAAYAATVAALEQDWGSITTPANGSDDFGTL